MLIDLNPIHLDIIRKILAEFVPQLEVWAFGSRVHWTAREFSDIDLVVITDCPIDLKKKYALEEDDTIVFSK